MAEPGSGEIVERLNALESAIMATGGDRGEKDALLVEAIERVEKGVGRLGREQFKINAVIEEQQKSLGATLEQLRETASQRERELARLRDRLIEVESEGQLDVVRRLLPALDGLEEARASGRRLLARAAAPSRLTLLQRLNPAARATDAARSNADQALNAWIDGLDFVHDRMLEALAAVDVAPMITVGRVFDPHRHIAVEAVPAEYGASPGVIVGERRRGYVHGDTPLRYAEVVVASARKESS